MTNPGAPPSPIASTEAILYKSAAQHFLAGRFDQAEAQARFIVTNNRRHPEALNLLGILAMQNLELDRAAAIFSDIILITPNSADAHCNLGIVKLRQQKYEEALTILGHAISLNPSLVAAHISHGDTLRALKRLDESIAAFQKAIALKPENPDAHYNLSMALLARGDYPAGWHEHEWRWQTPRLQGSLPTSPKPLWRGEPAAGKTLLVLCEQGLGDTLQFCRYAPLAAAAGLRVIVATQAPLVRLLKTLPGVDQLISLGDRIPAFDLFCPMMSLPLALDTTLETVPANMPYLRADPQLQAHWQTRLGVRPDKVKRVGLIWAGNPRRDSQNKLLWLTDQRRSIDPIHLAPLFDLPNLEFYSLQKDGTPPPPEFKLIDFMPEMQDFADTAALIANLDLVISVDTSSAHLAGALNKPIWLLDRFDPCWRWLTGRVDSPWYPALHIYRQNNPGDWRGVISDVSRDLKIFSAQDQS